jgi:two-component system nitrate/nitrite response regulator NarL
MTAPTVVVIDDHELLAHSAAYALRAHGIDAQVVDVTTLAEMEAEVLRIRPQIVLLDLHLGALGLSTPLIARLHAAGLEVVVLTGETDRAAWGACIEAGAAALVEKRVSFDDLVERLRRIIAGDAAMAAFERIELLDELHERRRDEHSRLEQFTRLTTREAEVLQWLIQGESADEIAAQTYVSVATVRSHIRAILQMLGVNSQLAAVAAATKAGWQPGAVDAPTLRTAG